MAHHIRSVSMPSTSHPVTSGVEEEIHNLKAHLANSSKTSQMMSDALRGVGDLYESIQGLLFLPSNQCLYQSQTKLIEELLDDSLKMLDLISAVRDSFAAAREHVHDLRSTVRRNGNAAAASSKKFQNSIKDCRRALRQMHAKSLPASVAIKDGSVVIKVRMEVRESTISLLQMVLSFLSKPKQKANRWFIMSKAVSRAKIGCEGELEATAEESAYMWLGDAHDCLASKDVDAAQAVKAQNRLETLEIRLEALESGLDYLFRRLIQNRVSLLNLLGS